MSGWNPAHPERRRAPLARGAVSPDRVYLGWQYELLHADPGPPPRRPAPPPGAQLSQGWADAQRREGRTLSRPARLGGTASLAMAGGVLALDRTGMVSGYLATAGLTASLAGTLAAGRSLWLGRRDLRARVKAEELRVSRIRVAAQRQLAARQEVHAGQVRTWQARRQAFERQSRWYAVSLPRDVHRVDLAGGTLAGWSAILTMIGAPLLGTGSDVTVLDLTEGAVARDLLAVARRSGVDPLVWVLPGDLPRLDLGTGLSREALADVLAVTAAAGDDPAAGGGPAAGGSAGGSATARASTDSAILDRVLRALAGDPPGPPPPGPPPPGAGQRDTGQRDTGQRDTGQPGAVVRVAQVTAALRALAQVADPRDDLRAGLLSPGQLDRVTTLFGRGAADRVVTERALLLESRLRRLDSLAAAPVPLPPTRLRVASLDRRAGALGNAVVGTYLVAALTHLLRQVPPARPWRQVLCVLGAERLAGGAVDRLCDACEMSGTGLVVGYRSIPAQVRERLGRGNAALAFMRLGNAAEARAASEQIGTEHRFVLSQLTDSVGASFTDTAGESYTSTVGDTDSVSYSVSSSETRGRSRGRGRSHQDAFAPFGNFTGSASRDSSRSVAVSDSASITAGISTGTSWGVSTSRAAGASSSAGRTTQRSREFLVEQHELQQLPPSAVIVSYAARDGRRVVLADANPGIIALPAATLLSLEEARRSAPPRPACGPDGAREPGVAADAGAGAGRGAGAVPASAAGANPQPNLGPPPARLDWRSRSRRRGR